MPPTQVRPATRDDAAAIADLLGQLGHPTRGEQVTARLARLSTEPGQTVLVAEADGEVVGMATVFVRHLISADAPLARIAAMVVDERARSRGIGAALVAAAETLARDAGCDRVEVTSAEHRVRAHAFYRRLDYRDRPHRFMKQL
jgi:GNAT superfamily N-acetyltransferase